MLSILLLVARARVDDAQDQLAGFVGKPVYDENGALLGNIKEVVVADRAHGNQTVALLAGLDGDITTIPLGETETLIATISAAQIAAYEEVSPMLISPDYITPESRGS